MPTPYASKGELKDWLFSGGASNLTADDGKLDQCVEVASQAVDAYTGVKAGFVPVDGAASATAREFETRSCRHVFIDEIGAEPTDLEVETSCDGVTWASLDTTYLALGPSRALSRRVPQPYTELVVRGSGSAFEQLVRVTTSKWGWPEVPPGVKLATLLIGAWLYTRAEAPMGMVVGEIPARVPRNGDVNVQQILDPLCRVERTIGIA